MINATGAWGSLGEVLGEPLGGAAMIQEGTLIEAILGFRAQIDFLWQFFVTVHIASS
jgi:hypothetical protein